MDRVGGGLDVLIRRAAAPARSRPAGQRPEAMPSPDPAPLKPADASPPPDEVLDLLYRSGERHDLGAAVRRWRETRPPWRPGCGRPRRRERRLRRPPRRDGPRHERGPHGRPAARLRAGPVPPRLFSPRPGRGAATATPATASAAGRSTRTGSRVGPAAPLGAPDHVPGRRMLAAPRPPVRRHGAHLPWPSRPPAPRDPRPWGAGWSRALCCPDAIADAIIDAETAACSA